VADDLKGVTVPVNHDFIGREYVAETIYDVSREKIRDFAVAIGDLNPVYLDVDAANAAGYSDVIAPPTFLTVLGFRFSADGPIADPDFGVDYTRVVHGEQRFVAHRPVQAGDRLASKEVVEGVRGAGGNEMVTTRISVWLEGGEPVADIYSTLVVRGDAGAGS
jgi:acyl dehydratase